MMFLLYMTDRQPLPLYWDSSVANALPPVLESTGGSMLIVFNTNGNITESGWKANYYGKIKHRLFRTLR